MLTVHNVIERFAYVQANDDARLLVETAAKAVPLPADSPMAVPFGQGKDALFFSAQIKAGMYVDRLGFLIPGEEATLYRATYIKCFLLAVRQELLAYLCAQSLPR